ncbi:MAG: YycH family regulatory protein [Heyndrickxia sp.]
MKFETIKTIILTVLVAGSMFLTWTIWTYKPSYKTINPEDVTSTPISDPKKVQDLIKPSKVVLHQNHTHLGTVKDTEINRIIHDIQGLHFFDIGTQKTLTGTELRYFIQENNHMEIDFPSRVPFDIYRGILQFNKKQTSNVYFDKIVVDFAKGAQKEKNIYFIDTENRKIASSSVSNNEIQSFLDRTQKKQSEYQPYELVELGKNHYTYLPSSPTKMKVYEFTKEKQELDTFKRILFNDPASVQKNESKDKIEYVSITSLMKVDLKNYVFSFVNTSENSAYRSDPKAILKQSIEFVNEHGGWTGDYRYFSLNNNSHEVVFRLFRDGYPVFNSNDMAEIQQYWGEKDIQEYQRPFISLDAPFDSSDKSMKTGKDELRDLLSIPHIQKNSIEDLALGYQLTITDPEDSESLLYFEPTWYCLYDGTWSPVSEIGRVQNGME